MNLKSLISNVVSKVKEVDLKLGAYGTPLSKQLLGGAKTAIIAVPATKALELPGVGAKILTGAKAVGGAVATSIKTTIKNNPIKSAVIGTAGTGYIASNPKQALKDITVGSNKLIEGLYNTGYNVGTFRSNPTMDNFTSIYTENPLIAGLGTAVLVGGAGYTAAKIIDVVNDKDKIITSNIPTETNIKETVLPVTTSQTSNIPLTPETQVLGKAVSSSSIKRKSNYRRKTLIPNIRVNVINDSRLSKSVNYINKRYN